MKIFQKLLYLMLNEGSQFIDTLYIITAHSQEHHHLNSITAYGQQVVFPGSLSFHFRRIDYSGSNAAAIVSLVL
jgi:hypothetical protein